MNARDWALFELDQRDLPGWLPGALRRSRPHAPTDPRDLGLAEQIFMGVIQNHLLLQNLIEQYSGRRLKNIDPLVQKILSIGLYQLRFLDRVPESAVVNEAVEQTKRFGRTKAAGFMNAVLRKAARDDDPPDQRIQDPARRAQIALSHPPELFGRLVKLLGVPVALRFCEHDNRQPPSILRVSAGADLAQLQSPGVTITPHERPGMFVVDPAKKPVLAEWAKRGWAQVQDPTAAGVVDHCGIEPGQSVLDRCAGLGTKTLQLQERTGAGGTVVAIDPSVDRCRQLKALLAERHISNVTVHEAAMMNDIPAVASREFDVALADVPCSNSGVLARRPEARYAQTHAALASLEKLQNAILDDTAPRIRIGGRLIYSTCSVWPEENERLIDRFLKRHPNFTRQDQESTLPTLTPEVTKYHDGGYWCVLRRES